MARLKDAQPKGVLHEKVTPRDEIGDDNSDGLSTVALSRLYTLTLYHAFDNLQCLHKLQVNFHALTPQDGQQPMTGRQNAQNHMNPNYPSFRDIWTTQVTR
jgi:hypothetical protein